MKKPWSLLALFALAASGGCGGLLLAEDKWTFVKSGPFEVWTNGSDKQAKYRLLEAEQFRHVFGTILAKPDLKSIWPVHVLAVKDKRASEKPLTLVRDAYVMVTPQEVALGPVFRRDAALVFLEANAKRYPAHIEQGLVEAVTWIQVDGTRVSLVAPPADSRTLTWARLHFFLTDPAFSGKFRVYLSNLEQGGDEASACRNAFAMPVAEVEKLVKAHQAKGSYAPFALTGRPINADKDYYPKTLPSELARIAEVDAGMAKAVSLADLLTPESYETQEKFDKAVEAGSKSPNAWLRYGQMLAAKKENAQAQAAFKRAAELNMQWGAPYAEFAKLETTPARQMFYWKKAAELELRNVAYWEAYATSATEANQYNDAAKGWAGAERAAPSAEERARLTQARRDIETRRADYAEAERRRASEERYREIERLKAEALGEIRKAEAGANARMGSDGAPAKDRVEKWWDPEQGEKVTGTLTRVDCLAGGMARLHITGGPKARTVLIREPSKLAARETFGCGIQKPARKVEAIVQPKPDAKWGTAGDVVQLDFVK